ncbi:TPA: hypothetical protein IVO98_000941, partial [Enterococcus faecium]|nr:hypothetical protein [Enterococcus faecium]
MRISEKVVRIGLILMVALSIYFSYAIWLSPAGKSSINVDETNTQMIESQSNRKTSEVFLPLHVTWHHSGMIQETNSENLVYRLQLIIDKARFGKLSEVVSGDKSQFEQVKNLNSGFELAYNAPFLLREYKEAFDLDLDVSNLAKESENMYFTRIQFDQGNKKIRFLNYSNHLVYEANISLNWTDINKELTAKDTKWTEMTTEPSTIDTQYATKHSIKLKKYSYILSQQPYTLFRNAFFQKPDSVKNNDESNELIFYGGNETMSIHSETQVVDFRGELPEKKENASVFSESFPYISKLGSSLGNLRYFDRSDNTIDYRIFVEGFPV